MEVVVLPVTLVMEVYFVITRDTLFAELFGAYHGLMLVMNNSIQRVICETDSLEVLHLLQDPDHSHMHVYVSLLVKIFGSKRHIPNISFQHAL